MIKKESIGLSVLPTGLAILVAGTINAFNEALAIYCLILGILL